MNQGSAARQAVQQQLIRLISLLFCSAMGEISSMDCPEFEIIDPLMDNATLVYVQGKKERSEVLMNWIQRLVVDNIRSNTVEIAPPIVSRVFQEFSLGIVDVAAAKKINFIPFPFPYSQMMQLLLIMQAIVYPRIKMESSLTEMTPHLTVEPLLQTVA